MTDSTAQLTVIVSILSTPGDGPTVRYTYFDPLSHQLVRNALSCILNAYGPFDVLFSLDYQSSTDGWKFVGITPNPGGLSPSYSLSSNALSLTTFGVSLATYSFQLTFQNLRNPAAPELLYDDPQENNLPRPTMGTDTRAA